jgi:hypothetical protein
MVWLLLAGLLVVGLLCIPRRRRPLFTVLPAESISTAHLQLWRKHTARKKAALDAATAVLR